MSSAVRTLIQAGGWQSSALNTGSPVPTLESSPHDSAPAQLAPGLAIPSLLPGTLSHSVSGPSSGQADPTLCCSGPSGNFWTTQTTVKNLTPRSACPLTSLLGGWSTSLGVGGGASRLLCLSAWVPLTVLSRWMMLGACSFSLWLLALNLSDRIYWHAYSPRVGSHLLWSPFGFETCAHRTWHAPTQECQAREGMDRPYACMYA